MGVEGWLGVVAVPVTVAVIGILPVLLKMRRENDAQHRDTASGLNLLLHNLDRLDKKVDRVETKVDQHLGEHRQRERAKVDAPDLGA